MSREKVLIVEDEQNERTGLAELVSSWGYLAETARDGQEGYEKVNVWSPAIVVTDLKMPRMGGLELLEKIAADSQTVAVIVVTAQGTIDSAVGTRSDAPQTARRWIVRLAGWAVQENAGNFPAH